ncbi:MAG: hypothetical protein AAB372_01955 [Patescibacteria group bacterium]
MATEQKPRPVKTSSPPQQLAIYQRIDPREASFFGRVFDEAVSEERQLIFGIKRRDRRRPMYIVGKSGTGKSKLLELLVRQDIVYGKGICVIDPYGALTNDLLDFIPEERLQDVVVIDPSDHDFPISWNPLTDVGVSERPIVAEGIVDVLRKLFGTDWTHPLEYVLRFAILGLLEYPKGTLRGLIPLLTNDVYRNDCIDNIQDTEVRRFWSDEYPAWSQKYSADTVIPLVNKLGNAMSHPYLRAIFAQRRNRVDFKALVASKSIILVNLAKDKLGDENAALFGGLVLAKLKEAGISRGERAEDFYLYFDEFSSYATSGFGTFCAQARQYGFCVALAHQYTAAVDQKIISTILGNVGTMIAFRLGGEDAPIFDKELAPVVVAKDLLNLGRQQFYIKMTVDGDAGDAFLASALKILPPTRDSQKEAMVRHSHDLYTVPLESVQKMIQEEEATAR